MEFAFEALFAQHPLSPAKALDAISIAAATTAVLVSLIMVSAETRAMQRLFNSHSSRVPLESDKIHFNADLFASYLCEPDFDSARFRLSAAPFNWGLRRSAASNSGMLSCALSEASRTNPKLL